ncbi:MAG TPA: 4'-phosphopantetheinyl transferase superfamily protein [Capsulimonadaceae bacterium]
MLIDGDWKPIAAPRPIGRGDLHLWLVPINVAVHGAVRGYLTPHDQQRADRFVHDSDRDAWVTARGALRHVLSGYLSIEPSDVRFGVLEHGKPVLIGSDCVYERLAAKHDGSSASVQFNLSHTSGFALIGVTLGNPIGVDIEKMNRTIDPLDLAPAVFASDETDAVRESHPQDRLRRFLEIWTMKEAWLKMVGCGLVDDLASHSILAPTTLSESLRPAYVARVSAGSDVAAAVAAAGPVSDVSLFAFSPMGSAA